ncbi:Acetyl-CoA Carboxylase [Datura stramonium]|uniref:Acetyl-CoA Carboxylase n=1 Tax=Datura stramonium TaxID=4076 RepID=A0ABS8WM72_DATST|nr:Acetyl-CoA Carboxylase [Datura stramonium]
MSESQRRPAAIGIKSGNGYINGALPLRSPISRAEVAEFCHALGGKRPVNSILIANNGMAAVKFIRSIRTWAYETFGSREGNLWLCIGRKGDHISGPPATSMAALGDKIGSSLIAQAAEVPTLPREWLPYEIYAKACVYTTEEAIASCQVVGYPAMIKASKCGGKGIRKVHNDDEVRALFKQVQG